MTLFIKYADNVSILTKASEMLDLLYEHDGELPETVEVSTELLASVIELLEAYSERYEGHCVMHCAQDEEGQRGCCCLPN